MKYGIYVTTYRRPEMCIRLVSELRDEYLGPIVVVHPFDEIWEFKNFANRLDVRTIATRPEHSGTGAGAPHFYAGNDAIMEGLDVAVFLDDDIARVGRSLELMVNALHDHSELGACTWRGAFPPKRMWLGTDIALDANLGIAYAIRMSAYLEVGGFDPELARLEDGDLALRLRLAGYEIGAHRKAIVRHDNYVDGGLSVTERPPDAAYDGVDATKARAAIARQSSTDRMIAKYAGLGLLKRNAKGWVIRQRGPFAATQELYKRGALRFSASGYQVVEASR